MSGQAPDPTGDAASSLSTSVTFKKEAHLQKLLLDEPSLLPGVGRGPVVAAREVSAPKEGPIDLVVVGSDGQITLVECKRAKNPEARRWVIGQLLGYAAWLWKLSYWEFKRRFERTHVSLTASFKETDGWSQNDFQRAVADNLRNARLRLVIAADEINESLKRAVVFLNSSTLPETEVLAVSIDAATSQVTGVYEKDSSEAWSYTPRWKGPRRKILESTTGEDAARAASGLLRWADDNDPDVVIDFKPKTNRGIIKTSRGHTVFRIEEGSELRVSFHALDNDEERNRLRADLVAIDPGFAGGRRPMVPLDALVYESKRDRFLTVMESILVRDRGR